MNVAPTLNPTARVAASCNWAPVEGLRAVFLGLGIQPPAPSLGTMLATAQQFATRAPWAAILPGVAIMVLALAFNVFGDSLRDALDPKGSRE